MEKENKTAVKYIVLFVLLVSIPTIVLTLMGWSLFAILFTVVPFVFISLMVITNPTTPRNRQSENTCELTPEQKMWITIS